MNKYMKIAKENSKKWMDLEGGPFGAVYYGCTKEDAGSIGFRDDKIYEFLKGENVDLIDLKQIDRKECFKEMENYKKNQGIIY